MDNLTIPQMFAVWALPVLFAITLHEVSHGWIASKLGDQTARMLGRLTLNPIKHIDPIGTIIVPGILLALGGFIFGWAKPVPVNYRNLRHPKRDMALVAAAGPLSNFLMALIWACLLKIALILSQHGISNALWLGLMSQAGIMINLVLMVLNFLPFPPLDGSHVLESLLPLHLANIFRAIEPYGFIILIALMYLGVLSKIIMPPVAILQNWVFLAFGIV